LISFAAAGCLFLKSKTTVMKIFAINQNKSERVARCIVSLFLLPAPFVFEDSTYALVIGTVGAVLLFNAVVGTCYIYRMLGVDTCKI